MWCCTPMAEEFQTSCRSTNIYSNMPVGCMTYRHILSSLSSADDPDTPASERYIHTPDHKAALAYKCPDCYRLWAYMVPPCTVEV